MDKYNTELNIINILNSLIRKAENENKDKYDTISQTRSDFIVIISQKKICIPLKFILNYMFCSFWPVLFLFYVLILGLDLLKFLNQYL